jgi:hypothetical protein
MMIGVDREAFALQVMKEIRRWPGVQIRPHLNPTSPDPDDGVEFRLYGRQIGHIHHDCSVHLSFTRTLKQMVLEQGLALPLEQAGGVRWGARGRWTKRGGGAGGPSFPKLRGMHNVPSGCFASTTFGCAASA